jgi:hypothetical protein
MKVAIYARFSTDDKGQDLLNQLLELADFATRQGWTMVWAYTEATAKNEERTGNGRAKLAYRLLAKDGQTVRSNQVRLSLPTFFVRMNENEDSRVGVAVYSTIETVC